MHEQQSSTVLMYKTSTAPMDHFVFSCAATGSQAPNRSTRGTVTSSRQSCVYTDELPRARMGLATVHRSGCMAMAERQWRSGFDYFDMMFAFRFAASAAADPGPDRWLQASHASAHALRGHM